MSETNKVLWKGTLPAHADTSTIAQVSITTTATQIVALNNNRHGVTIVNHSSVDVYLGKDDTVTTTNGILLRPKQNAKYEGWDGTIFGIVASGTATVGYWEMET